MEEKFIFGERRVRKTDPDVFTNPDSARAAAKKLGCIGIRRYSTVDGGEAWMPCTNESDYRKYSGIGPSGARYRQELLQRDLNQLKKRGRQIKGANQEMFAKSEYTNPQLRNRLKNQIMNGSRGGRPGQWSARKAQLLAMEYRKRGGGYRGKKSPKQRSLSKWTKEKWRTSDGKPAIRGSVTRRYLPAKAWSKLTPGQRRATNAKKISGSRRGQQFVPNTQRARSVRKAVSEKSLLSERINFNFFEEQQKMHKKERFFVGRQILTTVTPNAPIDVSYKGLTADTTRLLVRKTRAHNAAVKDQNLPKWSMADIETVKKIWQKAMSVSVAGGVPAKRRANERINAYFEMLISGKPSTLKYISDIGLLPNGHPLHKKMTRVPVGRNNSI